MENWANKLEQVGRRIGHHFARVEPGKRAIDSLRGLLSETERKNGWQLAEATPHAVQHLLGRADWDADAGRDDSGRVDSRGRGTLAD